MWSGANAYDRVITSLLPEFEKAFPDVELEVLFYHTDTQKLLLTMAGGVAPDIVTMVTRDAGYFIEQGLFRPLDISVFGVETREEFIDLWYEGAQDILFLYDELYFIPTEVTTFALYWNKDLVYNAGFGAPPSTWEEMLEQSKLFNVITEGDWRQTGTIIQRGQIWNSYLITSLLRQMGIDWITEDGLPNFDHPKAIEAMEVYRRFYVEEAANPAWGQPHFAQGQSAFFPGASFQYEIFTRRDASGYEVGVAPYPVLEDGVPSSPAYAWGTFVPVQSENPELAWKVAKFFSDYQWAETWFKEVSILIPWKGPWVANVIDDHPQLLEFLDAFRHAKVEPVHPKYSQIFPLLRDAERKIVAGESDVRSAFESMNAQMTAIMSETN